MYSAVKWWVGWWRWDPLGVGKGLVGENVNLSKRSRNLIRGPNRIAL